MEDISDLDSNAHNGDTICEDSSGRMRTDSIDHKLIHQSLKKISGTIGELLSTALTLWTNGNLNLLNLDKFEATSFPQLVDAIISSQYIQLSSTSEQFHYSIAVQDVKKKWCECLATFSNAVSIYISDFTLKLGIQRDLQAVDFEEFAIKLLSKCLIGVSIPLARKLIILACEKIKEVFRIEYVRLHQNSGKVEPVMVQINKKYEREIAKMRTSSDENELKESVTRILKEEEHILAEAGKGDSALLILRMIGQREVDYGKKCTNSTNTQRGTHEIGLDLGKAVDEAQVDKKAKEKVAGTSKSTRKESSLFHNVREESDLHHSKRVENTDIYYFDGSILASSSTAIVYEGRYGVTPYKYHRVAVKRFFRVVENELHTKFANELKMWAEIDEASGDGSVYVARLLTHRISAKDLFLVIELADMDLGKKVACLKKLSGGSTTAESNYSKLVGYIKDVSRGLEWLHSCKNIIHRDIKPGNILIFSYSQNGRDPTEMAKLTDFGISRIAVERDQAETGADGTLDWAAPEVIQGKSSDDENFVNTKSQDIFSLGLTAHFTLSLGEHPFVCSEKYGRIKMLNILDESISGAKLHPPYYIANDFIQAMTKHCKKERVTSADLLKHSIFWKVGKGLDFVVDFARIVDEKVDDFVVNFRETVDKRYVEWYEKEVIPLQNDDGNGNENKEFDWKEKMGNEMFEALQKRKMNKGKKNYRGNSVIKLVELIQDKYMHSGDMVAELKTDDKFGKDGVFCPEKYGKYFLETFPDILVFLKSIVLSECCDEYPDLKQLREKYF